METDTRSRSIAFGLIVQIGAIPKKEFVLPLADEEAKVIKIGFKVFSYLIWVVLCQICTYFNANDSTHTPLATASQMTNYQYHVKYYFHFVETYYINVNWCTIIGAVWAWKWNREQFHEPVENAWFSVSLEMVWIAMPLLSIFFFE